MKARAARAAASASKASDSHVINAAAASRKAAVGTTVAAVTLAIATSTAVTPSSSAAGWQQRDLTPPPPTRIGGHYGPWQWPLLLALLALPVKVAGPNRRRRVQVARRLLPFGGRHAGEVVFTDVVVLVLIVAFAVETVEARERN